MIWNDFNESFRPLAVIGFGADKLPGVMEVYFKAVKDLDGMIFREACLKVAETDDISIAGRFPSPNRFRAIYIEAWKERNAYHLDRRVGNRPQDIAARAEFFNTLFKVRQKKGTQSNDNICNMAAALGNYAGEEMKKIDSWIARNPPKPQEDAEEVRQLAGGAS